MPNKLIKERLPLIIDQCKTQREAAELLGASVWYIYYLTRRLGITKWRQKNREYKPIPTERKICQECGEVFTYLPISRNPGRFCSKKCQGKWLGRNYGFKKKN